MGKLSRQLEYLITSAVLLGVGVLFYLLNGAINSMTVLHFSLFQILQSIPLLMCGALRWYGEYAAAQRKEQEAQDAPDQPVQTGGQDMQDSANASMGLLVLAVAVVGYYMLTMKVRSDGAGLVAPLHLVICVVAFIVFACVERWWALRLSDEEDAAAICNLMVLNKAATLALGVDLLSSFTGLFQATVWIDYFLLALWAYVSAMCILSAGWKLFRHGQEPELHLYVLLPVYYAGGREGSSALDWLERNTGISMRSLWSLKFIKTVLPSCCFAVVILLWLSTCIVQVEAYQQGALYRFGRLSPEDILDAGLHVKLPVPFETVSIYDVQHPQSMIVGYEGDVTSKNNLWTRPHEGEEQTLLLGDGKELVAINLKVTYRISDLYAYLTNFSSPERVLNAKGYEVVMDETVSTDIDCLISSDRSVLSQRIGQRLRDYAQAEHLGLEVMSVTLASIHPPVAIADVYQSVVSADTQRKTAILVAEGEALVAQEQAEAQRQTAVNDAGIQRSQRVSAARAETDEYNAGIEAYLMDPEAYLLDRYLESFEAAMAGRRKYIIGPGVDIGALYGDFGSRTRGAWFTGLSGQNRVGEGN